MSSAAVASQPRRPIFAIGRQHSGNTMLVEILGNAPSIRGFRGEGQVFEHHGALATASRQRTAEAVVGMIDSDPDEENDLYQHLLREVKQQDLPPLGLWAEGMAWLAARRGAPRWIQCATSYVFYVKDILQAFPEARLLYPIRNPLDIAASKKGRYWSRSDDLVRSLWGWNAGNRTARELADEHPDRLMLFRYEDFVAQPEKKLKALCSFCDVDYSAAYLDVPHTNRSRVEGEDSNGKGHGISTSRLYYYREVLSPEEEAVVRLVADDELLSRWYPDLPSPSPQISWSHRVSAARFMVQGALAILSDQGRRALRNPRHVLDRTSRRLRTLLRR